MSVGQQINLSLLFPVWSSYGMTLNTQPSSQIIAVSLFTCKLSDHSKCKNVQLDLAHKEKGLPNQIRSYLLCALDLCSKSEQSQHYHIPWWRLWAQRKKGRQLYLALLTWRISRPIWPQMPCSLDMSCGQQNLVLSLMLQCLSLSVLPVSSGFQR